MINNIKQIKDMDKKFVLTLLFICFTTNIFSPLKYIFLFLFTTYNITPAKLKKNNTVPTITKAMDGLNIGSLKFNPVFNIDLYANPSNAAHRRNDNKYINVFLNFIFSFFLPDVNNSIILYFEITNALNIITSKNIIPKYNIVLPIALVETANLYSFIETSNNFNVKTDNPCDTPIPIISPAIKDITPTIEVSVTKILDIFLFPYLKSYIFPILFYVSLLKNYLHIILNCLILLIQILIQQT